MSAIVITAIPDADASHIMVVQTRISATGGLHRPSFLPGELGVTTADQPTPTAT